MALKVQGVEITSILTVSKHTGVDACMSPGQRNLKSLEEIPGPLNLPIIGPLHNFLPGGILAGCSGYKLEERLYKLYGPLVRIGGAFGSRDTLLLFDPEAVEQIFRSEEPLPIRPGFPSLEYYLKHHNEAYDPKQATGLLTEQGDKWKELRSTVNPIMLQPKTIKLYSDVLDEISEETVRKIRSVRDENNEIRNNFDVIMQLWALESLGAVALGMRLNCFDPNLPEDSPVKQLVKNTNIFFDISEKMDYKPNLWRLYATPLFKEAMKIYENHQSLTKYFTDEAIKKLNESKNGLVTNFLSEKSLLEKFLAFDIRFAYVMASEMLLGGTDTTSITVNAILYQLATNPEKQKKLREEISAQESRKPYLRACIKEAMRMMSVFGVGNGRITSKEHSLLGYKIPKDVLIIFGHQYMSALEEHFPKPGEFIPERWLVGKDDPLYYGNTHSFVMMPFGFGVRMCIGRRIAELMMESIITKIIQNFQIDWTAGEPISITATTINRIKEPFHFIFKDLLSCQQGASQHD